MQYQYGLTGTIKTFNFDATTYQHLASQSYAHCIRQEAGYCCVQYQASRRSLKIFNFQCEINLTFYVLQVCADEPNPFSIDTVTATASVAGVDTGSAGDGAAATGGCTTFDYIQIECKFENLI